MSRSTFFKDSWNYLSSEIATKGLAFISIPVFTRLLTPEDYGYLNVITSIAGLIVPIITLNMSVGLGRYYFEKDQKDFDSFMSTSLIICLLPLLAGFGISLFLQEEISRWLSIPVEAIPYVFPTAILLFFSSVILSILRAERKSKELRMVTISRGYLGFFLAAGFMYFMTEHVYLGRMWANVIVLVLTLAWFLRRFGSYLRWEVKWNHIRYLFSYGMPLLPASISAVLLMEIDRIMINSYRGGEEAGLYSFAYNISMLLLVVSNAMQYAFLPDYYSLMNQGETKKVNDSYRLIISLISVGALGLILFGSLIGQLLGTKSFASSLQVIPVIVVGQYFLSFVPLFKQGVSYAKKNMYATLSILIAGGLNVILNAIYIPVYGSIAGAYTTVASYLVQLLVIYGIVKYVLKHDCIGLGEMVVKMLPVALAFLAYYGLISLNLAFWPDLALRLIIMLILAGILVLPYRSSIVNYVN